MTADRAHATTPDQPTWTGEWTTGDRFRKVRRHTGLSQAAFAELIGQNPKNYSTWESDNAKPRQLVAVAMRIQAATGVPASWVLGMDDAVDIYHGYVPGKHLHLVPSTQVRSDHMPTYDPKEAPSGEPTQAAHRLSAVA